MVVNWPYPRWIAHRGAGRLAPENTLAAFRLGHAHGYRMFECDVRLSADGVPFLLHDDLLERTSDGYGPAAALDWSALSKLDAGSWHSLAFRGEHLPSLEQVMHFCHEMHCALNVELKPAPGSEHETGRIVAETLAREWRGVLPPVLSSFQTAALAGARQAADFLPRAMLVERLEPGYLEVALDLGCAAMVVEHTLVTARLVEQLRPAGLALLAYTVNDDAATRRLLALGIQGLITDRVDHFDPVAEAV